MDITPIIPLFTSKRTIEVKNEYSYKINPLLPTMGNIGEKCTDYYGPLFNKLVHARLFVQGRVKYFIWDPGGKSTLFFTVLCGFYSRLLTL